MTKEQFHERLTYLYGYPVPQKHAIRLRTYWLRALNNPVTFATSPEEVRPLSVLINWRKLLRLCPQPVMLDPCAGEGTVLRTIKEEVPGLKNAALYNNDVSSSHCTELTFDCVTPDEWAVAPSKIDIIMSSPPWNIADCMFPDFVSRSRLFTAMHNSGDWIASGPIFRRLYWAWLVSQNRAVEIRGLLRVKNRPTRRCTCILSLLPANSRTYCGKDRPTASLCMDPE